MSDNLIIVDITDREYTQLDVNSEIKSIKGDGKVITRNPTQKSSLWDIVNDFKEIDNTSISEKVLEIENLNPGEDHVQDYEIQDLKEPCLKIIEIFDTGIESEGTINNVFLYKNANKCKLTLTFTNQINKPITEIKSKREIPSFFTEIDFKPLKIGKSDLVEEDGKRFLNWEIETLGANETAELQLSCTVNMQEKTKQSLGDLKITYLINDHSLTMINPVARGLADSMSGVTRDEGSNPGSWNCNIEFVNNSEFKISVEDVKVEHNIPTGKENVVSLTPNQEIDAKATWDHDFNVESPNVPKLDFVIKFTPLYTTYKRVIGEIVKESTIYDVFAAEITKEIIPPEVVAYANTDMKIVNKIPIVGTASMDTFVLEDNLPEDFIPPTIEQIILFMKNPEVTTEIQDRKEFVEDIKIEPNDVSPDTPHKITVSLKDLKDQFPSGSELKITYPILAKNPKPEVKYETPVQIKANTTRKGKDFVLSPPEEPVIKIKYLQRKFKTLKSVKPGTEKGSFNITVRIQNKGDVELENILVQDIIPTGFILSEFTPPKDVIHKILPKNDETELRIKISELKGNNSIIIDYLCTGSGKYPRSEPEVTVLGREDNSSLDDPAPEPAAPEVLREPKPLPSREPVSEDAEDGTPKTKVSKAIFAKLDNIFLEINKKVDSVIIISEFLDALKTSVVDISEGFIQRDFAEFTQHFEAIEDKSKKIIGTLQDEIREKLTKFKKKFVSS